jgi:excisionase family DNA binding protein
MPTHFAETAHDEAGTDEVGTAGTSTSSPPKIARTPTQTERLAYSIQETACLLGVNYFSVYRLIQRGKLKACRALRGKLLVPRSELLRLLKTE